MAKDVIGYIYNNSKNHQIKLLFFIQLSFPFSYSTLNIPKVIVNEAIGGTSGSYDLLGVMSARCPSGSAGW